MANFKDIMAMCLDGGSYAAISAACLTQKLGKYHDDYRANNRANNGVPAR